MFEQLTYKERVNTVVEIVKAQLGTQIESEDLDTVKATCISWEVPAEVVLSMLQDK